VRTLLAVVTAAFLAAAAAGVADSRAKPKPTLRILDRQPLVVRGGSFSARERVVLYAALPERTIVRRLTATRAGTFVVRFEADFGGCTGVRKVRVVGTRSGTATIASGPITRECPPPPAP
jgi:hypothetical protein